MRIAPEILETADDVGRRGRRQIADAIAGAAADGPDVRARLPERPQPGRHLRSTSPTLVAERGLDLSRVVIAMMDEYVEKAGRRLAAPHRSRPAALLRRVRRGGRSSDRLNAAATGGAPHPATRTSGSRTLRHRRALRRALARLGGIDLFLLASGASDGHVALNPVGAGARHRHPGRRARRRHPPRQPRHVPHPARPRRGARARRDRRRSTPSASSRRSVVMVVHRRAQARRRAPVSPRRTRTSPTGPRPSSLECAIGPRSSSDRSAAVPAADHPLHLRPTRKEYPHTMAAIKLVYIGGGSSRGAGTMASFLAHGKEFDGSEVVIQDVNPDALQAVETIATKIAEGQGPRHHDHRDDRPPRGARRRRRRAGQLPPRRLRRPRAGRAHPAQARRHRPGDPGTGRVLHVPALDPHLRGHHPRPRRRGARTR